MGIVDSAVELNRRFGIHGTARVEVGEGGLPKVLVSGPAAAGSMYLHGGHLCSWTPRGRTETLYLSPRSAYRDGVAIRGGIPVCFPWFGENAANPRAPAHGLVRTKAWEIESIEETAGAVTVTMFTASNAQTRPWWPAEFRLLHRATFGSELSLELVMTNTGATPLRFEEALHTYFYVGDCRQARVSGLNGIEFIDKADSFRRKMQTGDVTITGETDRVYMPVAGAVELADPILDRRFRISKQNAQTIVVWNPWASASSRMQDLGEDEYLRMLCIEVANVGEAALELAPDEVHVMRAVIQIF
jgi:glucose-6-phosphate 1-epimerase